MNEIAFGAPAGNAQGVGMGNAIHSACAQRLSKTGPLCRIAPFPAAISKSGEDHLGKWNPAQNRLPPNGEQVMCAGQRRTPCLASGSLQLS